MTHRRSSIDSNWEVYRVDQAGHYLFTGLIVQASSHDKAHKLAAKTFKTIPHGDLKVRLRQTEDEQKKDNPSLTVRYKIEFEINYTSTKERLGDCRKEAIRRHIEALLYDAIDSEPWFQKKRIDYGKINVRTMKTQGRKRRGT